MSKYDSSCIPKCDEDTICDKESDRPKRIGTCCYPDFESEIYRPNLDFVSETTNYSDEQKRAIILYSKNGDQAVNDFILNNCKINKKIERYISSHIKSFNNFIKCSVKCPDQYGYVMEHFMKILKTCFIYPCKENLLLFRGITNNKFPYNQETFFRNHTFWSTSINKKVALGFMKGDTIWTPTTHVPDSPAKEKTYTFFTIYIPKGTKLCHVLDLSKFPTESEILLDSESLFYVKSRNGSDIELVLL